MNTHVTSVGDILNDISPEAVASAGPAMQSVLAQAPTPMAMLEKAVASGASIDTLTKLMDLQERWEATQSRRAFESAMALAKAKIGPIYKTVAVDYTTKSGMRVRYNHESLSQIEQFISPIMAEYGLSYRFKSSQDGPRLTVTCIIAHERGHREETTLTANNDESGSKNSIQAIGSAAVYLQRYTLKLAMGLSATADRDGLTSADTAPTISAEQFRHVRELIEKSGTDESRLLTYLGAASLDEITVPQYQEAVTQLKKKIRTTEGAQ